MYGNVFTVTAVAAALIGSAQALVVHPYTATGDPTALLVAEVAAGIGSAEDEGQNIVEEDAAGVAGENIATRCLMMQLSIVQGLTEHLSGELVAAVPEEVAEELEELLAEAESLEDMAIDIGAGEYEELQAEMSRDPAVHALLNKLDETIARVEEMSYYNCPELEDVVSKILNILSDLQ